MDVSLALSPFIESDGVVDSVNCTGVACLSLVPVKA